MTEKKKILVLSDHPLSPSGVGTQTKYFIESLLKTNRYKFICLGGAIKHQNYDPIKVDPWGDDWVVYPVDGYGSHDIIRSLLRTERPDILWFMTDPRFWSWLWEIEDEVRPLVPMVYYHVWDNYPYPNFNARYYDSTDVVVAISKLTHDVVKSVSPNVESHYLPHSVDTEVFKKLPESEVKEFIQKGFDSSEEKFTIFWNNRNARRKQSGSLIWWFNEFLNKVGRDKARLVMHTDPKDPNGQDLVAIMQELNLDNGEVFISKDKIPPKLLAFMYNMSDCTINISDAEGFGLATLESLACETPIIATMTGGLQEQVTDGDEWFGVGLTPASKAVIGSQSVPYIYEDRVCQEDVVNALLKMYNMTKEERQALGAKGRQHVMQNYNFEQFQSNWVELIDSVVENYGSWETRVGYNRWELLEVA
tara:strand:- start:1033 stop:2292 length:1260 start_codon:yes stop_codon:yes gene_type:complete